MDGKLLGKIAAAGFGVLVLTSLGTAPAFGQVNINVNIGSPPPVVVAAPPPVVVAAPPTMLFLTEPGLYVAVGVPYNIYFLSGRYYYVHGNDWFWASGYDGPWIHLEYRSLPPGLQKYRVAELHRFRDREYEVYRTRGSSYGGEFRAVGKNGNGQGNQGNQGNGRGNGRGRGNR